VGRGVEKRRRLWPADITGTVARMVARIKWSEVIIFDTRPTTADNAPTVGPGPVMPEKQQDGRLRLVLAKKKEKDGSLRKRQTSKTVPHEINEM
jgi:hypothetical protein